LSVDGCRTGGAGDTGRARIIERAWEQRMTTMYDQGLDRNPANYTPLTPVSFLQWAGQVYPDKTALIHGDLRQSWGGTWARCRRFASALSKRGIGKGDTVAIMAPNIPAMFE